MQDKHTKKKANSNLTGKLSTPTFNVHKTSGDHDGRYYTESEINDKLTMKELFCNVIPTKTGTNYSYQNNTLKNRGFVVAYFPNSVGALYIPAGKFAEGALLVQDGDQFWGGEINASYNASTGTVTFIVRWIGASQNIGNFGLNAVNYM